MIKQREFKGLLKKNKLKGKELAKLLGITYQSLYNKINNKQDFTANELFKICKILNCDYSKIFEIDY